MAKGDHKFARKPKGATGGGYVRPRVQIGFTTEEIKIISRRAKDHNCSFTAEVRALVAIALSSLTSCQR